MPNVGPEPESMPDAVVEAVIVASASVKGIDSYSTEPVAKLQTKPDITVPDNIPDGMLQPVVAELSTPIVLLDSDSFDGAGSALESQNAIIAAAKPANLDYSKKIFSMQPLPFNASPVDRIRWWIKCARLMALAKSPAWDSASPFPSSPSAFEAFEPIENSTSSWLNDDVVNTTIRMLFNKKKNIVVVSSLIVAGAVRTGHRNLLHLYNNSSIVIFPCFHASHWSLVVLEENDLTIYDKNQVTDFVEAYCLEARPFVDVNYAPGSTSSPLSSSG